MPTLVDLQEKYGKKKDSQNFSAVKNIKTQKEAQYSKFVGIVELIKTSISVPIRVMMSIVTQLKVFDINSNGLTPKGKNKRELKAEIIDLVSKLSEK